MRGGSNDFFDSFFFIEGDVLFGDFRKKGFIPDFADRFSTAGLFIADNSKTDPGRFQ